jgi:hypothetical protein
MYEQSKLILQDVHREMCELLYHENIISQSYLLPCSTSLPRGKLSASGFERSPGLIVPPLTNALPPGVSSALNDSTNSSYSRAASSSAR